MRHILTTLFLFGTLPHTAKASCESEKTSITAAIEAARACERDSDCTLFAFDCPFACSTPINAQSDVGAIQKRIESHRTSCGSCSTTCEPPRGRPACVAKRCTVSERAAQKDEPFEQKIKRFENELEEMIREARRESAQGAQNARQKLGDALGQAGDALTKLGQKIRESNPAPTPTPTRK